jgi:hypothetical protein
MADGSEKPIESMMKDDLVATPFGPKRVVSAWCSGTFPVWEMSAGDRSLIGTPNHPIMVNDEWLALDKIKEGEHTAYFYQGEMQWPSNQQECVLKALRSMDTNTTGIQTQSDKYTEPTSQDLVNSCTGQSGSSTMARFQKAIKFITLMGIAVTMRLRTSCVSPLRSIAKNMRAFMGLKPSSNTLLQSGTKPVNGTSQKKEWLGIRSMLQTMPERLMSLFGSMGTSKKPIPAAGVALKDLRTTQERSSAQLGANLPNQASALARQVRNTHTMQAVYNLEVEDVHCYYANDILVHNCISQGLRYLRDAGWIGIDAPPRDEVEPEDISDAEIYNRREKVNPYAV